MPPINLHNDQRCNTFVFDNLDGEASPILEKLFLESGMFQTDFVLYLKDAESRLLAKDAGKDMYDLVDKRANEEHRLTLNTAGYRNLFFLEPIDKLNNERLQAILDFTNGYAHLEVNAGAFMRSFLCIFKVNINTEEALKNMEACYKALRDPGPNFYMPRILLIDKIAYQAEEPWLRAIARMANLISRDDGQGLADGIRNLASDRIYHWALSEFDVEAAANIAQDRAVAQRTLSDANYQNHTLAGNLNKVKEKYAARAEERFQLNAETFPIPTETIETCFSRICKDSKHDEAADLFSKTVYDAVCRNAVNCFAELNEDEVNAYFTTLMKDVPLDKWEEVKAALQDKETAFQPDCEKILAASSMKDMRDMVGNTLRKYKADVKKHAEASFKNALRQKLPMLEDLKEKKREGCETVLERTRGLFYLDGIHTAHQYLSNCININEGLQALHCIGFPTGTTNYMLISDETNNAWSNVDYGAALPAGMNVYNFHDLQEFEFAMLTVFSLNEADYERSKRAIFRL